jgi:lysozyme
MKVTTRLIKKIKEFEGFMPNPYYDSAGVLTIGYGHTKNPGAYKNLTKLQAHNLLLRDLAVYEKQLNTYIKTRGYKLNQNQFDALVSFLYNVGSIRANSNLDKAIKTNLPINVSEALRKYIFAGGQALNGLITRRNWEASLYLEKPIDLVKAVLSGLGIIQMF